MILVSAYQPDQLDALTRLVNQQIAYLAPALTLTTDHVNWPAQRSHDLWIEHLPREEGEPITSSVIIDETLAAAGQCIVFPEGKAVITWLVASPIFKNVASYLIAHLEGKAIQLGATSIEINRLGVTVGWLGVPASWVHVINALRLGGFQEQARWAMFRWDTPDVVRPLPAGIKTGWHMNSPMGEWTLTAYQEDQEVGNSLAWAVPFFLRDAAGAEDWITLESIQIQPEFRRRGIALGLVHEQMRFHGRRGFKHWLGRAKSDHVEGLALFRSLGAQYIDDAVSFIKSVQHV